VYGGRVIAPRFVPAFAAAYLFTGAAHAHFILTSPPASLEQNQLGDPQKAPPCGDNGGAVPTGIVTAYQGGDIVTITIDETIYHPGHYRVALAVNDPSELPEEPPVTPNDTPCGTAPIASPPVFPVLADGIFEHTQPFDAPQSFDITLPTDVDCASCTLQVIQFMSNHGLNNPGGCYYHHCANISITSLQGGTSQGEVTTDDPSDPSAGETAGSPTTGVTTGGESSGGVGSTGGGEGGSFTGGDVTGTGGGGGDSDATAPATTTTPTDDDSDKGCGCAATDTAPATLVTLLGLLALRPRRRRR
jgi:MYXO-CTERM domain-containing protein